jgi:hypothetical protein
MAIDKLLAPVIAEERFLPDFGNVYNNLGGKLYFRTKGRPVMEYSACLICRILFLDHNVLTLSV